MLSVTIWMVAVAIFRTMSMVSGPWPWTVRTISAMSSAWSPMRSMSVIIFRAAEISRRSRATGCCWSSSFRHWDSISRSFWSISRSRGATFSAREPSPVRTALAARAMTSSQRAPISMRARFSSESCWSKRLRMAVSSFRPVGDVIWVRPP